MRMLNHTLGEDVFLDGIRSYVKENRLGSVEEKDLWRALNGAVKGKNILPEGRNVEDFMTPWTREPGYPVILITRDYANRSATLEQVSNIGTEHTRNRFVTLARNILGTGL